VELGGSAEDDGTAAPLGLSSGYGMWLHVAAQSCICTVAALLCVTTLCGAPVHPDGTQVEWAACLAAWQAAAGRAAGAIV
jgi:hypothetical protein